MVLNPLLFQRLQEEFGYVHVMNEGSAMVHAFGIDPHTGNRRMSVISAGEYYRANCPYCSDTRGRLWVNHRWGVQDEETGRRNLWLAICYNENCLSEPGRAYDLYDRVYSLFKNANLRDLVAAPVTGSTESRKLEDVGLPGVCIPLNELPQYTQPVQYLIERGYDPLDLFRRHNLSFCVEAKQEYGMANGRIIIPIVMESMTVGWQGRYPKDLNWKQVGFPKYYSRPNMPKGLMLYNFDAAVKSDYVVICEGPSDVWNVGEAGVAVMGKTLSDDQTQRIHRHWSGGAVFVMLDGEARDEADAIVARLNNFRGHVIRIDLPADKDPGDLSPEWLQDHIKNCAEQRGFQLDQLKREERHVFDSNVPKYCGFAPQDRPNFR